MEEHQVNQPSQSDQEQEEQKKMIPLEKATAYISWIKEKLELDDLAESVKDMAVYRGQVYWCKFGMGVGYEIQKRRPAVILQCNLTNKRNGNTIAQLSSSCLLLPTERWQNHSDSSRSRLEESY